MEGRERLGRKCMISVELDSLFRINKSGRCGRLFFLIKELISGEERGCGEWCARAERI